MKNLKEKENIFVKTEIITLAILLKINLKVKGNIFIKMEINIKGHLWMVIKMGKEYIIKKE